MMMTHAKLNFKKKERIIYIKIDLALNNLQRLVCHKTKITKQTNVLIAFGFAVEMKLQRNTSQLNAPFPLYMMNIMKIVSPEYQETH